MPNATDKEGRLWERIRRWLKKDSDLPEVILIFGLKQDIQGQWKVNWKASHWLENEEEGTLPKGIEVAISTEMAKLKLGDTAFELARGAISNAPKIMRTVMEMRRKSNGR